MSLEFETEFGRWNDCWKVASAGWVGGTRSSPVVVSVNQRDLFAVTMHEAVSDEVLRYSADIGAEFQATPASLQNTFSRHYHERNLTIRQSGGDFGP